MWRKLFLAVAAVFLFCMCAHAAVAPLAFPPEVHQHDFFTLKLPLGDRPANPYDTREFEVEGRFSSPSGRKLLVSGYYAESYDALYGAATHDDGWRLSFCPEEAGPYEARIFVRRGDEAPALVGEGRFVAKASVEPGFIGVGPVPTGYFEHRNGPSFFPIGLNYCWGESANPIRYLEALISLSKEGANCVRIWLAPWWLPVEKSPGRYDQRTCALLDMILDYCEKNRIHAIICVEQSSSFNQEKEGDLWSRNPYNTARGGPCATTNDFFADNEARRLMRQKLSYLIARYGARRSVMAWELFNEVELFPFTLGTFADNLPAVSDWHREMALHLRRSDPWRHMIATSSDVALQRQLLQEGLLDFMQIHVYSDKDVTLDVAASLESVVGEYGAPVLVGEFGSHDAKASQVSMRHGIWVSTAAGSAGAGLYWWEMGDILGEGTNAFEALRLFTEGINWSAEQFTRVVVEAQVEDAGGDVDRVEDVTIVPGLGFGLSTPGEEAGICTIEPDGSVSGADKLPRFLLGAGQAMKRNVCNLDVTFADAGKLILKVNSVSDKATLTVLADGNPLGQRVLLTGPKNTEAKVSRWVEEWKVYQDVYDKEYQFDVPAGKHRISISNGGKGWIKIDYIKLPGYRVLKRSPVSAWCLAGRSTGIVYALVTDPTPDGAKSYRASLGIKGVREGKYKVAWYDCDSGAIVGSSDAVCHDGEIKVATPEFSEHIAGRLALQR